MRLVLVLVLVLVVESRAHADDRVARALAAVRELGTAGRAKLDADLYAAARSRCHADAGMPSAACLIEAARALCATDARCTAAADVVASNLRSVDDFVDEATRARLVRGSTDYHAALAAELHKRYAVLATELALAAPTGDDATAIDRLCRDRDRELHACALGDPACVPSLPWSRCVAALIWYVGASP